jgi:diadenosine tetraphosphatase ApaH/serine/threonine PP2A family protein phosphatase
MRYLVISDIHANLEALDAVLKDAPTHDGVLFLGDLVGYGPNPNECVERLLSLQGLVALVGNHDLAALGRAAPDEFNDLAREAALWTGSALCAENRQYLCSLRPRGQADGCFMAHASPRDPVWEYLETQVQAPQNFALFSQPICFVGHTHVPRVLQEGRIGGRVPASRPGEHISTSGRPRLILNPGSVGQPRDGDPRAAYGLWNTAEQIFVFMRALYPVQITQAKILAAGLPPPLAYRLAAGA